jgi:sugar phosphate isomerase/epimerase
MLLGYNTNGMAHHELFDAIRLLAEIGYGSVAITIDHTALPPYGSYNAQRRRRLRRLLDELGMRSVIETGARFLLDPAEKHEPTFVTASPQGRARRIDFAKYAVDCAAELGSDCVSLWSGVLPSGVARPQAMTWLAEGLREVLSYAAARHVAIGFEPEPGMLVDSMRGYEELLAQIDDANLRLTLDVGHLHCQGETPVAEQIRRWAPRLVNVHLEDMRAGVHEHLMFGEGEIDFPPVLRALAEAGYRGGVHVELSRHSHEAPAAARRAMEFLAKAEGGRGKAEGGEPAA